MSLKRRVSFFVALALVLAALAFAFPANTPSHAAGLPPVKTVFIILMENHNWSQIQGSSSAPYINNTLLPMSAYATQYYNPPNIHPSLPNYLWLEAGTNFGILDDNPPSSDHQSSTAHLATLLTNAGISWRAYEENMPVGTCPVADSYPYAVRHDPFVYFDDIAGNPPSSTNANCIAHVVPYTQLATDLANNTTARYNFITPNVCDDMHDSTGCATKDSVANGDTWLSNEVPKILASQAYQNSGALFITWDEAASGDGPIGMMLLSPLGKGGGYNNAIHYTHSSTLRTMEEIFGVSPFLADAANATDLSDLFNTSGATATNTATSAFTNTPTNTFVPPTLTNTPTKTSTPVASNTPSITPTKKHGK